MIIEKDIIAYVKKDIKTWLDKRLWYKSGPLKSGKIYVSVNLKGLYRYDSYKTGKMGVYIKDDNLVLYRDDRNAYFKSEADLNLFRLKYNL